MQLTDQQVSAFDENGYLIFRKLFSDLEIEILQQEAGRIAELRAECVIREGESGVPKIMFRMHETDGPTGSAAYNAASRLSKVLGAAMQVLRDEKLYIHHSKLNIKGAIEGSTWPWHQDFGQWQLDGIERPELVTFMIMLDEATELGGCLHFQPGSHRQGKIEPYWDESTAYKLYAVPPEQVRRSLTEGKPPIPVTGKPGDAVLFHCNLLHASGQNLSAIDRRQIYFCFNKVSNHPNDVEKPRPDYVRSQNWSPLLPVDDKAIINSRLVTV